MQTCMQTCGLCAWNGFRVVFFGIVGNRRWRNSESICPIHSINNTVHAIRYGNT